ncbi:MAG: hypothetical protein CMQ34_02825 [Gammaproteobacteria bacterium]|nr:hypothetical protein [Gammaproteobacteria bacterium]|tara:strand:+ start:615 stop:908 length:294 start_codon:yes stop_codon:yes gene_type:complete
MPVSQEMMSKKIAFVLVDGAMIYPVKMTRRDNGRTTFRVSDAGNTIDACEEVDEQTMIQKVLIDGFAVRCASADGKRNGLYRPKGRAVREVRVLGAA